MSSLFRRSRRGRSRTRGQSLVEFALVTPLLLLVFAAAADFGRVFYAYVAIENAAKEGALFGSRAPECDDNSLQGCGGTNNVLWRVRSELDGQGIRNPDGSELTPTVACLSGTTPINVADCESGDVYQVSLTYEFRLLTPILGNIIGDLDLGTSSSAVVLNAAAPVGPNPNIPGISIDKFVSTTQAVNGPEVQSKCLDGQDINGTGYYRSPCHDSSTVEPNDFLMLRFEEGATISYRIVVRNTGTQPLSGVTVSDSQGSLSPCTFSSTIGPSASLPVCNYTRVAPGVPGAGLSMPHDNVATADAAEVEPVTAGVSVTVEKPPARLVVEKYLSPFENGSDGDGAPSFGTRQDLTVHYRTASPAPHAGGTVWFKIRVRNNGGQPATDLAVTDSRGPLTPSAACPAVPSTLAAGDFWDCRYPVNYSSSSPATTNNTASATATNVSPDLNDAMTATLRVQASCDRNNDSVVPRLIGMTKAAPGRMDHRWVHATLTTWRNSNGDLIVAQRRDAYSCARQNNGMTVFRVPT